MNAEPQFVCREGGTDYFFDPRKWEPILRLFYAPMSADCVPIADEYGGEE